MTRFDRAHTDCHPRDQPCYSYASNGLSEHQGYKIKLTTCRAPLHVDRKTSLSPSSISRIWSPRPKGIIWAASVEEFHILPPPLPLWQSFYSFIQFDQHENLMAVACERIRKIFLRVGSNGLLVDSIDELTCRMWSLFSLFGGQPL